jgi:hypothetical protein
MTRLRSTLVLPSACAKGPHPAVPLYGSCEDFTGLDIKLLGGVVFKGCRRPVIATLQDRQGDPAARASSEGEGW